MPFLPSLFASLSLLCLLVAGISWLWLRRRAKARLLPQDWALNARPVFNSDERRAYRHLRDALPQYIVLSKLPLLRFSQATDPGQVRYWYELLGNTSVAFAVCSSHGRVLLAIDLEGDLGASSRNMQIKQAVLAACKVRYLRCAVDRLPSMPELQALVPNAGAAAAGTPGNNANQQNAFNSGPMPLLPPLPLEGAPLAVNQARESLANTVATRRRERSALWQDSGFMQDSFFAAEGQSSEHSGFGALGSARMHSGMAPKPDEVGGIVIDTPVSPHRH